MSFCRQLFHAINYIYIFDHPELNSWFRLKWIILNHHIHKTVPWCRLPRRFYSYYAGIYRVLYILDILLLTPVMWFLLGKVQISSNLGSTVQCYTAGNWYDREIPGSATPKAATCNIKYREEESGGGRVSGILIDRLWAWALSETTVFLPVAWHSGLHGEGKQRSPRPNTLAALSHLHCPTTLMVQKKFPLLIVGYSSIAACEHQLRSARMQFTKDSVTESKS